MAPESAVPLAFAPGSAVVAVGSVFGAVFVSAVPVFGVAPDSNVSLAFPAVSAVLAFGSVFTLVFVSDPTFTPLAFSNASRAALTSGLVSG